MRYLLSTGFLLLLLVGIAWASISGPIHIYKDNRTGIIRYKKRQDCEGDSCSSEVYGVQQPSFEYVFREPRRHGNGGPINKLNETEADEIPVF